MKPLLGRCWPEREIRSRNTYGYIQKQHDGRLQGGHRLAYEALVGHIPDGMTIDHLCRNKECINPQHMEVVTRGENARRANLGNKYLVGKRNGFKGLVGDCKHGHPLNKWGYIDSQNKRRCRLCRRIDKRNQKARKDALAAYT